ncbi:uncharacterized protein LOC9650723 isoform X2 [Selaginella moellendorffii]|uniref:uncharacterized protein LOC9650723 isoform X2 n=1 Tax=Selaginella moellendorffii TaxID=88036 RepID=UPI000D1C5003|nr:uncharacterized protein LOC9650723 isoform X2 [Selaginella moellendorffii]|eukprot:XP_024518909.1 uncharacterized protein LOC9650723 isoform X2 [Selaginella moellendorffii]
MRRMDFLLLSLWIAWQSCLVCAIPIGARPHSASIVDFGAIGDGVTLNTLAFQNAMFYLSSITATDKGGAMLYVPEGRWLTGSFNLTSHFTLYLERGAVILGSQWPIIDPLPSYGRGRELPGGRHISLVHGENLEDVVITGTLFSSFPLATPAFSFVLSFVLGENGTIDGQGAKWWRWSKLGLLNHTRGHLVEFVSSTNIIISNVTLVNSPFWTLHPVYCTNVLIQGVTILAPQDSPNTDGIDPGKEILPKFLKLSSLDLSQNFGGSSKSSSRFQLQRLHPGLLHQQRRRHDRHQERLGRVRHRLRPAQLQHPYPSSHRTDQAGGRHSHRKRDLGWHRERPGGRPRRSEHQVGNFHPDWRRQGRLHPKRCPLQHHLARHPDRHHHLRLLQRAPGQRFQRHRFPSRRKGDGQGSHGQHTGQARTNSGNPGGAFQRYLLGGHSAGCYHRTDRLEVHGRGGLLVLGDTKDMLATVREQHPRCPPVPAPSDPMVLTTSSGKVALRGNVLEFLLAIATHALL